MLQENVAFYRSLGCEYLNICECDKQCCDDNIRGHCTDVDLLYSFMDSLLYRHLHSTIVHFQLLPASKDEPRIFWVQTGNKLLFSTSHDRMLITPRSHHPHTEDSCHVALRALNECKDLYVIAETSVYRDDCT